MVLRAPLLCWIGLYTVWGNPVNHPTDFSAFTTNHKIRWNQETLKPGDRLIVSELSRLGRSLHQILQIVDRLMHQEIRLVAIKESISFEGKQNLQTKAMIALFGLFAEVERDLIAERTKEGLAAAKAKGRRLGRPKGALGKSKLDGKEAEIKLLLQKKVSKASIARIVEVSPMTLDHFIHTRKLQPSKRQPG